MTPKFGQGKDWMRTGNHVRMIEMFGYTRLDELIFGNSLGTKLAQLIRYKAMLPFCRWAQRRNIADEERGRNITFPIVDSYHALGLREAGTRRRLF